MQTWFILDAMNSGRWYYAVRAETAEEARQRVYLCQIHENIRFLGYDGCPHPFGVHVIRREEVPRHLYRQRQPVELPEWAKSADDDGFLMEKINVAA